MCIKIEDFELKMSLDNNFEENSSDNINYYDNVYLNKSEYQPSTKIGMKIFENNVPIHSSIIISGGGATPITQNSYVLENDRIFICCGFSIFCLSIPNLKLEWKTKVDDITCFEIFKHNDDYIIHGELEISKINKNGEILWSNSGADIFVTLHGDNNLVLSENYISVKDYENRIYKFDYLGNDLTDMKQF